MMFPAPLQQLATAIDLHIEGLVERIPVDSAATLWDAALTGATTAAEGPEGFLLALELVPMGVVSRVEEALTGHVPSVRVLLPGPYTRGEGRAGAWGGFRTDPKLDPVRHVLEVGPRRVEFLLGAAEALMPRLARLNRSLPEGAPGGVRAARHLAAAVILSSGALAGIRAPGLDVEKAVIRVGLALTVLLLRIEARLTEGRTPSTARAKPEQRPAAPPAHAVTVTDGLLTVGGADAGSHAAALTDADFHQNGLLVSIPGGFVIRTGAEVSLILVTASEVDTEPSSIGEGWDDVVEVSFSVTEDRVRFVGSPSVLWLDRPGDHRAWVHARRRDAGVEEGDGAGESYQIVVWAAPPAPERVIRTTDQLGHRLRGEPEPVPVERPELAYRAVSRRFDAATVTVSVGNTLEQVLSAFRADPTPQPSGESWDEFMRCLEIATSSEPGGTAIVVLEPNGYRGTETPVLTALSRHGRAASMYRNVNAVTRLSLAENGELLDAVEWLDHAKHPTVRELFHGLDIHDYTDKVARGLVVIERFTGCAVTADRMIAAEAQTVGYRLEP